MCKDGSYFVIGVRFYVEWKVVWCFEDYYIGLLIEYDNVINFFFICLLF